MDNFKCKCMNKRMNKRMDNRPQFIIGGRQNKKTLLLIKEASITKGVIVCPSHKMATYIFKMAREIGYPISMPITYDQLSTYHNDETKKRYHYFDEYGIHLLNVFCKQLNVFERLNVKSIIIDEGTIDSLNDIIKELKVSDMSGKELSFKIEVLGRNESND